MIKFRREGSLGVDLSTGWRVGGQPEGVFVRLRKRGAAPWNPTDACGRMGSHRAADDQPMTPDNPGQYFLLSMSYRVFRHALPTHFWLSRQHCVTQRRRRSRRGLRSISTSAEAHALHGCLGSHAPSGVLNCCAAQCPSDVSPTAVLARDSASLYLIRGGSRHVEAIAPLDPLGGRHDRLRDLARPSG